MQQFWWYKLYYSEIARPSEWQHRMVWPLLFLFTNVQWCTIFSTYSRVWLPCLLHCCSTMLLKGPSVLVDFLYVLFSCLGESWYCIYAFLQEGKPWLCVIINIWTGFLNKMCQPSIMISLSPGLRCPCWVIVHCLWPRKPSRHVSMLMRCKSANYHFTVFMGAVRLQWCQDFICFKELFYMLCWCDSSYGIYFSWVTAGIFMSSKSCSNYGICKCKRAITQLLTCWLHRLYPYPMKMAGGILDSLCPTACPSVNPSIHQQGLGFQSIFLVCFGISFPHFICTLLTTTVQKSINFRS